MIMGVRNTLIDVVYERNLEREITEDLNIL